MKRSINRQVLRAKIEELGEGGIGQLHRDSLVSYSTIEKLRAGTYRSNVSAKIRRNLCTALKIKEEILFPLVTASEETSS